MSKKPAKSPSMAALQTTLAQAMQLHQGGFLAQAEAVYRQILSTHARHIDALHLLGVLCVQSARADEGVTLIQQAVQLNGMVPAMQSNLGNALMAAGRPLEAVAAYNKAIAQQPGYADAHCNKGNALRQLRRLPQAIAAYEQAIALNPQLPEAWSNRGNALSDLHRHAEAVSSFDQALGLRPAYPEAWSNRGAALSELGQIEEALKSYAQALSLQPGYPEALNNQGNTLREAGQLEASAASFREALSARPHYPDALSNLGVTLQDLGQQGDAIAALREALAQQPEHVRARSNLLFSLSFAPDCSPQTYLNEARAFGQRAMARVQAAAAPAAPWLCLPGAGTDRPLRVGFVSGDLRHHPVGFFLEGLLNHLDPAKVQAVAFSTRAQQDALGQRLQARWVGWHVIGGLDDAAAAALVREQAIDVLVDLAGHTAGNMLGVFAHRPAPVQLSWLGFLASTGLPTMDGVLADAITVPPGQEGQFTEQVWRMPVTANCFTPPANSSALSLRALPALSKGHITWGCTQNPAKINEGALQAWGRILQAVPGSRLRMQNKQLDHEAGRQAWLQRLQGQGIDPQRLDMVGSISGREAHLAALGEADIALDTFPYPGITTTCEALWMGVPTLTLAGQSMLSRQGASLMNAVGLSEWVASDVDDYVARAARLASDVNALSDLRQGMRERVQGTALFNPALFAQHWQEAVLGLYQARMAQGH
jgi:predicted O-linked N-acetylglucosamine transferase (SPINDLY family)